MKLVLLVLTVMCMALMINAEEEKMTDEEIQELINGYKTFDTESRMSAPVSQKLFKRLNHI